jgi:hypothetical protein
MRYVIYCYTNKLDGMQYVGQTRCRTATITLCDAIKERSRNGYIGCWYFADALKKYGINGFTCEVLDVVTTLDGANRAETCWIKHLRTLAPDGNNLDSRGRVKIRHPETIQKIREAHLKNRERRSEMGRRLMAAKTPEQLREAALKGWANSSPKRRENISLEMATRPSAIHRRASLAYWVNVPKEVRVAMAKKRRAEQLASTPLEKLQEIGRKNYANKTPEQRERMRAGHKAITAERWSEAAAKREALMGPTRRHEAALKAWATKRAKGTVSFQTSEQRSENMRAACARMTPEQRSNRSRMAAAAMTPEQRTERARKVWETRRKNADKKLKDR